MDNKENIDDELASIAPLLKTIDRTPVQFLPTAYFEQFNMVIPPLERAPIIKMQPRFNWIRYATAAVVVGVLVMGAFLYTNNSTMAFEENKYGKIDFASEINQLSDEDLQTYLSSVDVLTGAGQQAITNDIDFVNDITIEQIPDEELLKYLNENTEKPIYKKTS